MYAWYTGFLRLFSQLEVLRWISLTIKLDLDELDLSFQIHFDGWELDYDYWTTPMSPYIHPLGWCEQNGVKLNPPKGEFDD